MNVTVVVPTIREECAKRWVQEWKADLDGVRIIFVEDNPQPTFFLRGVEHYSWADIDRELGADSWIIPRRTSACRSYGFLKALESDTEIIWTMDDDCYPEWGRRFSYVQAIQDCFTMVPEDTWWNTLGITGAGHMRPRGYPYDVRGDKPVMVHHGLWSNVPDLDGATQLKNPDFRLGPCEKREVIPSGKLFPMCIMNVAFTREMTPAMYMLLMGKDGQDQPWGFDRFDDIWGGVFMKKIADHLGYAVTSGAPSIKHSRASDPNVNFKLEAAGMAAHEKFWRYIDDHEIQGGTVAGCYKYLAEIVGRYDGESPRRDYWYYLSDAMKIWAQRSSE